MMDATSTVDLHVRVVRSRRRRGETIADVDGVEDESDDDGDDDDGGDCLR